MPSSDAGFTPKYISQRNEGTISPKVKKKKKNLHRNYENKSPKLETHQTFIVRINEVKQ